MDDGLLRRLRTEQARVLFDDADPHEAVMLACDLLVAGVDGDAVVTLASESVRTLSARDANRRLAAVVAELGLAELELPVAVALVAGDTCERILDRRLRTEEGIHGLYVVGHEGSPLDDLLPAVAALAGRLEDDLGGRADDELRSGVAALARAILNRLASGVPS
ncbi:hypothetical protein [Actinoplanes regularis]|uniref:hypothetical protein n=1 Tax=Actinoplanes regularis TaxID=52697 RepID=UPI0025572F60|nr:hypothetical protein [Actinoplanes regularis]